MKREERTSRGMLPVYRDVHPDRCPVEVASADGSETFCADVEAKLVERLDRVCAGHGQDFRIVVCAVLARMIEREARGEL